MANGYEEFEASPRRDDDDDSNGHDTDLPASGGGSGDWHRDGPVVWWRIRQLERRTAEIVKKLDEHTIWHGEIKAVLQALRGDIRLNGGLVALISAIGTLAAILMLYWKLKP